MLKLFGIILFIFSVNLFPQDFEKVGLINGNKGIEKIELPPFAPATTEDLSSFVFPYPLECCMLDFGNKSKGKFIGPDGGMVSLWKKGNWQWERKDGYKANLGGTLLSLRNEKYQILAWTKDYSYQWIKRSEIHFPDNSILTRWWNRENKIWMYLTEKEEKSKLLISQNSFLPEYKKIQKYEVHYKKEYEKFVKIFFDSKAFGRLKDLLKDDFGSETTYDIPVLFFETLKEFGNFLQEKKPPKEGGRGNRAFVAVCCNNSYEKVLNRMKDEKTSKEKEEFDIMVHEMTHSILAHGCLSKSKNLKNGLVTPGMVFTEGIAEWAVSTVNPRYRTALFEKNYSLLKRNKFPKDFDAVNRFEAKAKYGYPPMYWLWYYLELKFGKKSLNEYHTLVCNSAPEDGSFIKMNNKEKEKFEEAAEEKIFKNLFKKTRKDMFNEMKLHFVNNKTEFEKKYDDWNRSQP